METDPKRVQRKRTKGWKMPANTVYVGRPTKWGNPFKLVGDMIYIDASHRRKILSPWVYLCMGDLDEVIRLYTLVVTGIIESPLVNFEHLPDLKYWMDHFAALQIEELRGKNLACFCNLSAKCHADILLKITNERTV